MRAFVLARGDSQSMRIGVALAKENPDWELFVPMRENEDVKEYLPREIQGALECDMVVMGVGAELMPHSVAIAATAATMGAEFKRIEVLVKGWRHEKEIEVS